MNKRGNVKFLVDIEKACLMTNFEKRNWVRGTEGKIILSNNLLHFFLYV